MDLPAVTGGWVIDDIIGGSDAEADILLEGDSDLLVVNDGWIIDDVCDGTDNVVETLLKGDLDWLVVIDGPEEGLKSLVDAFVFVDTDGEKFGSDVSGVFEVLGFDIPNVVKRTDIEEDILSEVFDFLEVTVKSILSVLCLIEESIVGVGISMEEKFNPNGVSLTWKCSTKSEKWKQYKNELPENHSKLSYKLYFT